MTKVGEKSQNGNEAGQASVGGADQISRRQMSLGLVGAGVMAAVLGLESLPESAAMAAAPATSTSGKTMVEKSSFGKTKDGTEIELYTFGNPGQLMVKMATYGATVVSVETPDKNGKMANIQLGFPTLAGYLERHPYFGSTVGRYGNRIAKGKFTLEFAKGKTALEEKTYKLAVNNGPNHLHGGLKGFDAVVWKAKPVSTSDSVGVEFSYTSPDGEEGYPGKLEMKVTYSVTKQNELRIDYTGTTDKPTVVNMTNHCYWNLGGAGSGDILGTDLMVNADGYLPIDADSIPTGKIAPVKGTAFDFTTPHKIGERIDELKKEPHTTKGYDHCFVLKGQSGKLELAAKAVDSKSGRVMEIFTTEPGIQLYCGNFLTGAAGEGGFHQHGAFCLETQHYPDSPNQKDFPTTVLMPGSTYRTTTVHRFSLSK